MSRHKHKKKPQRDLQSEGPAEDKPAEVLTCDPRGCAFFSVEPEVFEDKIIDGVRQRKVKRSCLYDLSTINSWRKICPRKLSQKRIRKEEETIE